ncbi:MAG: hypothetical protein ACREES_01530, partial [Stellaceae bacterium]
VAAVVARARAEGIIVAADDSLVARAIFDIYSAEVRRWLADDQNEPNLAHGLTALRRVLQVLVDGLRPQR